MNFELLPILTDYANKKKRGDEIKKKSSPLKLLSQSEPSFAEKGSFQQSLVEIGSVVSEGKISLISSPLFYNLHNRSKSVKVQS
jgi:hypothetical protein